MVFDKITRYWHLCNASCAPQLLFLPWRHQRRLADDGLVGQVRDGRADGDVAPVLARGIDAVGQEDDEELLVGVDPDGGARPTTYKEGWKTDRGMIYIMFGSPIFIDTQLGHEVWRYSYDDRDGLDLFVFNRRRLYASEGMFETFLLEREPYYESAWRRALHRWRRGEVL